MKKYMRMALLAGAFVMPVGASMPKLNAYVAQEDLNKIRAVTSDISRDLNELQRLYKQSVAQLEDVIHSNPRGKDLNLSRGGINRTLLNVLMAYRAVNIVAQHGHTASAKQIGELQREALSPIITSLRSIIVIYKNMDTIDQIQREWSDLLR